MYDTIIQRDRENKELLEAYRQAETKENDYLYEIQYYEKELRKIGDDMERKD